ncbi:APC family permease [Maribius pontilimi]|uniref:APC family permease n=1 Tax=Palleronia pontilimi TaxID=1964209 RepID=A0A934IIC4_9RHOB|nr:APC family permease [Palleronia pontilimi]MBJ3763900.1 APC family permease [Palleronia pontilimi]
MSDNSDTEGFQRILGRWDILALAFGAMVGWGWVVLAGTQIREGGTLGAILAFAAGGFAVFLISLTYAELCSAMPKTGGEHIYSYRALGVTGSFICTWAIILGYVAVVAFEAVALPTVMDYLVPGYAVGTLWTIAGWEVKATWVAVGVIGALVMTWVNYRGISFCAAIQKLFTLALALVGLALIFGSFFTGTTENTAPLFVNGFGGWMAVLVMTPFLLVGFDVIPQAAEEIDLPYRTIGKVLLASVLMAVVWYMLIIFGTSLMLDSAALEGTDLATADALAAVVGAGWGGKLLVFAGICGILTSWNSFFIGGSRAIYAMAHSGMLPAFLAKLHPVHRTPVNAILLIGGLSAIAPLFGRSALVWLVNAGGLGIVIAYVLVAVSFLILRKREPDMERPYTVPYGEYVGWAAVVLGSGLALLYMPGFPSALVWPAEWIIVGLWTLAGAGFWMVARQQNGRQTQEKILRDEVQSLSRGTPAE